MPSVRAFTSTPAPPGQRGVEFGRAHRDQVRRTAARYAALFERRGAPGFDIRRWAAAFRESIGDLDPAALAEIIGIAEGAALDPLEVVAVNARTEILAKADPYGARECSAVLVLPEDGPAYGVQTWDWYAAMSEGWLRWRIPLVDPGGRDAGWLETVTEYGLLAKIGVSSRGVGVLLNILHHRHDDNELTGLPVHLLSRQILTAATSYDDARALCASAPVSASTSLSVVDPHGGGSIELFPGGPGVLEPSGGLLVRTNHFLTDPGRDGCLSFEDYPSTRIRFCVLDERLRADPPHGPEDVLAAMRHHHADGGVCRHPDESLDPQLRTATLATVVVEPAVPSLRVTAGGPCEIADRFPG